jgi:hypothetical protein
MNNFLEPIHTSLHTIGVGAQCAKQLGEREGEVDRILGNVWWVVLDRDLAGSIFNQIRSYHG